MNYDVAVIGAGAAGLMAAIHAAERGRRVLLLEKNRKAGVKILMSGGTRCNITHDTDNRGIVAAYGSQGPFLHSPLAALSVRQTVEFFEAEGVATKVESTGKIFPVSDKALDVLAALLRRLNRSGATLALQEPLKAVVAEDNGFTLTTPTRSLHVPRLILTTGGRSYPGCGTTGDGYEFAKQFGHTIVPTRPALVPITVDRGWVEPLRGLTIPDVALRVLDGSSMLTKRRGSLLFAHFGLSGPVALDASRAISLHARPRELQLELDFLPRIRHMDLETDIKQRAIEGGKRQVFGVIAEELPQRLKELIFEQAQVPHDRRCAVLSKVERSALIGQLKAMRVHTTGTLGFEKAEVTAGGVALDEVDSRTMQSKLVPGLFFAGEILDLDGPIGGYNFQAAWSTGWLAGQSV